MKTALATFSCDAQRGTSRWQPILTGDARIEAILSAREIAAAIRMAGSAEHDHWSLAGGDTGIALFFAYLDRLCPGEGYDEQAAERIERAIQCVASVPMQPALYSGFPGIAWTVAHLSEADAGDDDPLATIDEVLCDVVGVSPWQGEYDLVSGLTGLGVYALERLPAPAAVEILKRVIDRLDELAEPSADGVTWPTPGDLLARTGVGRCDAKSYNLGVAHGMPGVIGMLAQALAAGVAVDQSGRLLEGAVRWLLSQMLPDHHVGRFAYANEPGAPPIVARLAWCYSEAGIAPVLLAAARSAGRADWETVARQLARAAAERPDDATGVQDAGLCHGAAGLGHLFNRLYQSTGDSSLLKRSRRWFRRALAMRDSDRPLAGFASLHYGPDGKTYRLDDPGFLEGAAGIGLALAAAAGDIAPDWDRVLLASTSPYATI